MHVNRGTRDQLTSKGLMTRWNYILNGRSRRVHDTHLAYHSIFYWSWSCLPHRPHEFCQRDLYKPPWVTYHPMVQRSPQVDEGWRQLSAAGQASPWACPSVKNWRRLISVIETDPVHVPLLKDRRSVQCSHGQLDFCKLKQCSLFIPHHI